MWASIVEYHRPDKLKIVLDLLARSSPHTVPLAGGSWLVAQRDSTVEAVVELSHLNLAYVRKGRTRLRLGAMTNLQALVTDSEADTFAGGLLAKAAQLSGPPARRNVATVGGTVVAGGSTDVLSLTLLALDAQIFLYDPARKYINLESFLSTLPSNGLITEIVIAAPPPHTGAALESISRTPRDKPIVNAVSLVVRKKGKFRAVRLALGGVAPVPIRLKALEADLAGRIFDDEILVEAGRAVKARLMPPSDSRASAEYRREMAEVVAVRALRSAWEQAG